MAEFDVKQVTNLEWAGIGAGVLAFVVSFFPWYSVDVAGFGGGSLSAWNSGFLAWFPVLLLIIAGGVLVTSHMGVQVQRVPMIWLATTALSVVLILLRWLTLPDDGGIGSFGLLGDSGVESGAGFGLVLGLIAAIVSGVAAFLVFRRSSNPNTSPQTGTAYGA